MLYALVKGSTALTATMLMTKQVSKNNTKNIMKSRRQNFRADPQPVSYYPVVLAQDKTNKKNKKTKETAASIIRKVAPLSG